MASIGHVAIGLAARKLHSREVPAPWSRVTSMCLWSALSLLPDADVLAFRFGIPYGDPFGHRGATHSLCFAVLIALGAYAIARATKLPPLRTALLTGAVVASHGLIDSMTDGGLGCALLWPFSNERFFSPWTPIPVAPIGLHFLSMRGARVAGTELVIFAIPLFYGLWPSARSRPSFHALRGKQQ